MDPEDEIKELEERLEIANNIIVDRNLEIAAKQTRIDELLIAFRRLTTEVPYAEEKDLAGILIAEVGTLRSRVIELGLAYDDLDRKYQTELELAECRREDVDVARGQVFMQRRDIAQYVVGIRIMHELVDQTSPTDPVGIALTRAGFARKP